MNRNIQQILIHSNTMKISTDIESNFLFNISLTEHALCINYCVIMLWVALQKNIPAAKTKPTMLLPMFGLKYYFLKVACTY